MLSHTQEQFSRDLQDHDLVCLHEKIVFDAQTPISTLYRFIDESNYVLLESISEQFTHDRFSYLGLTPYKVFRFSDESVRVSQPGYEDERISVDNIYTYIQSILDQYSRINDQMPDYATGLMGYLSYECMTHLESVSVPQTRALGTDFATLMIPKEMLIFDNLYHTLTIVRTVFSEEQASSDVATLWSDNLTAFQVLKDKVQSVLTQSIPVLPALHSDYESLSYDTSISEADFLSAVETCKSYIKAGDIFQIQVSRRASLKLEVSPMMVYRHLRNYNPSPYLYHLKFDEEHLIGASPEILVGVKGREMTIRPLAGTRKRYSSDRNEAEIIEELCSDDKEKAEHIMLVDLARHDIGRACEIGSVHVHSLMDIEKYTHVIHMVSDVKGQLRPECGAVDALKYGFPAGTVTGTPKIRAMEIISDLESVQREFYSGGVVFFDFKGDLKSALAIRSLWIKDGVAHTQAAAGVVADSVPELEYKETSHKMRACLMAMNQKSQEGST